MKEAPTRKIIGYKFEFALEDNEVNKFLSKGRKQMKRLIFVLACVSMFLALAITPASAAAGYRLVAGQNLIVGHVFVTNDANNLYITFDAKYDLGFCLNATHLQVVDLWTDVPQNNGNPQPGQFDYKSENDCVDTVSFTVPLAGLDANGDGQLTIAAHAEVGNWNENQWPDYEETGWGAVCGNINNNQFPGANWAVFAPYSIK